MMRTKEPAGIYAFKNLKTGRVECVDSRLYKGPAWASLASFEAKSISKGHVWQQLRYVPVGFDNEGLKIQTTHVM